MIRAKKTEEQITFKAKSNSVDIILWGVIWKLYNFKIEVITAPNIPPVKPKL